MCRFMYASSYYVNPWIFATFEGALTVIQAVLPQAFYVPLLKKQFYVLSWNIGERTEFLISHPTCLIVMFTAT